MNVRIQGWFSFYNRSKAETVANATGSRQLEIPSIPPGLDGLLIDVQGRQVHLAVRGVMYEERTQMFTIRFAGEAMDEEFINLLKHDPRWEMEFK